MLGFISRVLLLVIVSGGLMFSFGDIGRVRALGEETSADMRFVDAIGSTGYYVDAATIKHIAGDKYEATYAIVQIKARQRHIYRAVFDFAAKTYQNRSVIVESYDTKEVLRSEPLNDPPLSYDNDFVMKSIADFIAELR